MIFIQMVKNSEKQYKKRDKKKKRKYDTRRSDKQEQSSNGKIFKFGMV